MKAKVLWFTGLSGSGKTTIAEILKTKFESKGKKVLILDGDDVRKRLHKHLGFTPEDIKENNRLITELCKKELNNFDIILVPIISPFIESRKNAKKELGNSFYEVYIQASLKECIKRDVKGLYKKALNNEIQNFIGVAKNVPYEPPKNPDILVDTDTSTPKECAERIINKIKGFKVKERWIGEGNQVFIIAEAGVNHNGDITIAKRLIDEAKNAGCDAVKFQFLKAEGLYIPNAGTFKDESGKEMDIYAVWKETEFNSSWLNELKDYCKGKDIFFVSSVFDEECSDIIDPYLEIYKIASYELTHIPLLKHVARKGKPIIMSIAGAKMEEVKEAIESIKEEGNDQIAIMQCVGKYPAPLEISNVNVIKTLKKEFPGILVGFSDHSKDPSIVPTAAVANGASIIEKHFTLDRNMKGIDHWMSLEPNELKRLVKDVRSTEEKIRKKEPIQIDEKILGDGIIKMDPSEKDLMKFTRRKIFTMKEIKKGEQLTLDNLKVLRPGNRFKESQGLHPREYLKILNKVAAKDLPQFKILENEDINKEILLREANKSDCEQILEWRNDPESRGNSIKNTEIITMEEHQKWYDSMLKDPKMRLYIAEYENKKIGQIRFDIERDKGSVSIVVDPNERGKGYGNLILSEACKNLAPTFEVRYLIANIKCFNKTSIEIFKNSNFKIIKKGEITTMRLDL